jgi:cell division protein FtsW (lipid II flippase)
VPFGALLLGFVGMLLLQPHISLLQRSGLERSCTLYGRRASFGLWAAWGFLLRRSVGGDAVCPRLPRISAWLEPFATPRGRAGRPYSPSTAIGSAGRWGWTGQETAKIFVLRRIT